MCEDSKVSVSEDLQELKSESSLEPPFAESLYNGTTFVKIERLDTDDNEYSSPPAPPSPDGGDARGLASLFLQVNYGTPETEILQPEEDRPVKKKRGRAKVKIENPLHSYRCDRCTRSFRRQGDLIRHERNCATKQQIICDICHKIFQTRYRLKSHLRRHDNDRMHACPQCDMKFKHKSSVARHMMLHDGLKPYACPDCDMRFTSRFLMVPHLRVHTQEKPFQCAICLHRFAHKQNMERHMLGHNKLKHLSCLICHKQFPRESRLKYHMRVHWADNKPFKCGHCRKAYSCRQNILRHYRKKHPQEAYTDTETDAGLATKEWPKMLEQLNKRDYILPEDETEIPETVRESKMDILDVARLNETVLLGAVDEESERERVRNDESESNAKVRVKSDKSESNVKVRVRNIGSESESESGDSDDDVPLKPNYNRNGEELRVVSNVKERMRNDESESESETDGSDDDDLPLKPNNNGNKDENEVDDVLRPTVELVVVKSEVISDDEMIT